MMMTDRSAQDGSSRALAIKATEKGVSNGTHKTSTNGQSQNGKAQLSTYLGHDRQEMTRIMIQALLDMGYSQTAEKLGQESGIDLDTPTVTDFRLAVLQGNWDQAEEVLLRAASEEQPPGALILAPDADLNHMRFWLREQKFLELLERRESLYALAVLRNELQPLCPEPEFAGRLRELATLMMSPTVEQLKTRAGWDGAEGRSRQEVLSQLSGCISPSVMLPEHRLARLLHGVQRQQINECLYHTNPEKPSLLSDHQCNKADFPSEVIWEINKHTNEVWQVAFSHDGTRLASCGAERFVYVWHIPSFQMEYQFDVSDEGVGNLSWSPDDKLLVTCGRDHYAKLWDMTSGLFKRSLERFAEPVSSCVWVADSQSFVTGSFDKDRSICHWSLDGTRLRTWTSDHRTEDLAISPDGHLLVAMDDQHQLHIYNFATQAHAYSLNAQCRITSVNFSMDSRTILTNKSDGDAQLNDLVSKEPIQSFDGPQKGEYTIRNAFGGAGESHIIGGSEEGSVYIWHKSGNLVHEYKEAHFPRCNAVAWNPTDPCMFASCGDDNIVKIWSNKQRFLETKDLREQYEREDAGGNKD